MINLSINGKKLEVPEGTTVLNAARSVGITIPPFAMKNTLRPTAAADFAWWRWMARVPCSLPVTLPVSNNMVVRTDTAKNQGCP